ncbi:MAG: bifunctional DNA-formamidopyrimidine glycosylase/DNA-(apurinic or apyrimidinic site) lyase [Candidatus Omnitrophica bacterium]|nr:bifunctional DNA-formamidopyrimidine glycosylase/DNA-(apurinic or apyrimidinic site) lyase [Candidatus Omnitrophota bacterium]
MPELPEVQTVVNDLNSHHLCKRSIAAVRIYWRRSVNNVSQKCINKTLLGRSIAKVWRRGKYIVIDLDTATRVLIHLRMSGRISVVNAKSPRDKHEHVCITLDNSDELRLHDTRKFARLYIEKGSITRLDTLGCEPLDVTFTSKKLAPLLRSRTRALKPLLLDQTFIAGLGNIYTDEALWYAKLHPKTQSDALAKDEVTVLCKAIKFVLRKGIKNCGTSLGDGDNNFYSLGKQSGRNREKLMVYRRTGKPCKRCGTKIKRFTLTQRSTHLCPRCQKL